jgi:glycosyltransferase involved in cell wall biosynthesis
MPRVEAVIPTYNAPAARLGAAVASCQSSPLVERVWVVDDGSEPAASVPRDERVGTIRQANSGPSAARNAGLEQVRGEFALLLDDDDVLEPAGLQAMVGLAERTSAGAVVAARYEMSAEGKRLKPVPEEWRDRVLPAAGEVFRPIAIFGASGCLVRRSVLEAGVRFDTGLRIGEDRDFLRRVAAVAPIAVCGTPALSVSLHEGGENLTSPVHLARRVRDHLTILERYAVGDAAAPLREQTRWLLNAISKQGGQDLTSWDLLLNAARARQWPIPFKSRVRVFARRFLPHAR